MTDREKAIVMAHTGVCMLAGEKFGVFHAYIEDIMGRPVYTHELAIQSISDEIKEKSRDDFIKLCKEDQEPCEDAISRQAVLDTEYQIKEINGIEYVMLSEVQMKIRKMPSVTPQPKTGHWILSDDGLYRPICDKCGAHPWKGYIPTVEEATKVFKYCPNCGYRMIEPQERNDKEC